LSNNKKRKGRKTDIQRLNERMERQKNPYIKRELGKGLDVKITEDSGQA